MKAFRSTKFSIHNRVERQVQDEMPVRSSVLVPTGTFIGSRIGAQTYRPLRGDIWVCLYRKFSSLGFHK